MERSRAISAGKRKNGREGGGDGGEKTVQRIVTLALMFFATGIRRQGRWIFSGSDGFPLRTSGVIDFLYVYHTKGRPDLYNANILNDAAQGPNPSIYDPPGFEDTSSILLSRLVNKMGTAIMAIGWHDGIIKYANNQACRDLGKQCNDLPGRHYREIFRPEFIPL